MRYFSADYIFPVAAAPVRRGVLAVNDDGTIDAVLDPQTADSLPEATEHFEGLLCPGFVNTHCHVELSHLRGHIARHTGFVGFAKELIPKRSRFSAEEIAAAIEAAEAEMLRNGIVAVGDICNTADSFAVKSRGNLRWHSFVELLGLNPAIADNVFAQGDALLQRITDHPATLVPHAPYSVSPDLLRQIAAAAGTGPLSIHNQESRAENEFFEQGTGRVRELYAFLSVSIDYFSPPGVDALRATLPSLQSRGRLLLVHNTFTPADDIAWAAAQHEKLYWCFCPNANLYIEHALPDFQQFVDAGARITIGTDSLASNDQLSVLAELAVISEAAPQIPLETLICWGTRNGAEFLGMPELGTFEKGKKPGIVQVSGLAEGRLTKASVARRVF